MSKRGAGENTHAYMHARVRAHTRSHTLTQSWVCGGSSAAHLRTSGRLPASLVLLPTGPQWAAASPSLVTSLPVSQSFTLGLFSVASFCDSRACPFGTWHHRALGQRLTGPGQDCGKRGCPSSAARSPDCPCERQGLRLLDRPVFKEGSQVYVELVNKLEDLKTQAGPRQTGSQATGREPLPGPPQSRLREQWTRSPQGVRPASVSPRPRDPCQAGRGLHVAWAPPVTPGASPAPQTPSPCWVAPLQHRQSPACCSVS